MTTDFDAIVVGAGFAGVVAARELSTRGYRTLLLEARDRIGGRTWTTDFAGRSVELGGQWIHWSQPHVWAELTRYDIPVVADEEPEEALLATEEEPLALPAADVFALTTDLLNKVFSGADTYFPRPYEPLFRHDRLTDLDQYSLGEWLYRLGLTEEEQSAVTGVLATELGGSTSTAAVSMLAQWWALGGLERHGYYSLVSLRPEPGMLTLLEAMLADGRQQVRLGAPVSAVTDQDGMVRVTTRAGERCTARTVIVALPVNTWPSIDFTSGLPDAHVEAAAAGMGSSRGRRRQCSARYCTCTTSAPAAPTRRARRPHTSSRGPPPWPTPPDRQGELSDRARRHPTSPRLSHGR